MVVSQPHRVGDILLSVAVVLMALGVTGAFGAERPALVAGLIIGVASTIAYLIDKMAESVDSGEGF